jgi:fatty-acyl-CoA synthase
MTACSNRLSLMPGMFARMIDELHRKPRKIQPLGLCGAMADLVPRHEIAEITTLLQAPFRNSFGSTETGPAPFSRLRTAASGASTPAQAAPWRHPLPDLPTANNAHSIVNT